MKIAVYGSLKQGFYNYRPSMGEPLGLSTIRGSMYLCYSYPHLYRPEVSDPALVREHPVEIYDVPEDVYEGIRAMEIGAGYQEYPMTLVDSAGVSHDVIVFYSRDDHHYKSCPIEGYTKELLAYDK